MFKTIFVVVIAIACASAKPKAYVPLAYSAPVLASSAQVSSRTYNGIHHAPLAYAAPLTAAAYSAPLAAAAYSAPLAAPYAAYAAPYSAYAAHPYVAQPYAAHPYSAAYSPYVI